MDGPDGRARKRVGGCNKQQKGNSGDSASAVPQPTGCPAWPNLKNQTPENRAAPKTGKSPRGMMGLLIFF